MTDPVCAYQQDCSGCQLLGQPYSEQKDRKLENLRSLFSAHGLAVPPVTWRSAGAFYLRDRLDFTLKENRLGLFSHDRSGIVDLETCLQLSPALQSWLTDFRKFRWPLERASFRLRVGPEGQRGVWIDAANVDIKTLLDEKNLLSDLTRLAFVEIGQRRKVPRLIDGQWKLRDPEFHPWFQTWMKGKPVDLFCQVASFTQPSLQANRLIAEQLREWLSGSEPRRILEFGCGIGNLSFPALEFASTYTACEIDSLAIEGFRRSLEAQGLLSAVDLQVGDFQKNRNIDFGRFDLALCNPPRSGLKDFILPLLENPSSSPAQLIYMSCFPETLAQDLERLQKARYAVQKIAVIDQFPQTDHYEVVTLLERKK